MSGFAAWWSSLSWAHASLALTCVLIVVWVVLCVYLGSRGHD
jgi:hypothetical protein